MNVNDTEIAWAILQKSGYVRTRDLAEVGNWQLRQRVWRRRLALCLRVLASVCSTVL